MTPAQFSRLDLDEFIVSGVARLIGSEIGRLRVPIPVDLKFRTVYLFLEAITTAAAADFEVQAELEFRRNGCGVHSMPASIAQNTVGTFVNSRITAFPNVAAGTPEALLVSLGSPLAGGGSNTAVVTPQRVELESDEVWLNLLGSAVAAAGTFSGYRAFLAVRSSLVAL